MASTTPTPASFSRKAKLLWWAIANPERFVSEESADSEVLNKQTDRDRTPRIYKIRAALWEAFLWCAGSLLTGTVFGFGAHVLVGAWLSVAVGTVVVGTLIVLWATLALQGWEIQSYGAVTLGERLNRRIFRLLYSLGTALMVAGSLWSLSPSPA